MRSLLLALALALFASPAYAGKLRAGVLGHEWGTKTSFPAPYAECVHRSEPSVEWTCAHTIGTVPVTVSFLYRRGTFYGVTVDSKGFTPCTELIDTVTAAWGPSRPMKDYAQGKMDERVWIDGTAVATWKYNTYSSVCTVLAAEGALMKLLEKADAQDAAKAADQI
jgi:hypothetical protein